MASLRRLGWYLPVVVALALAAPAVARAALDSQPDRLIATKGGQVHAIAVDGNTLYVGGDFTRAGRYFGPLIRVSASTGQGDTTMPIIGGEWPEVHAVVSDGAGGWYIGGLFTRVGNVARRNLAHVLASGSVDQTFAPEPDGPVDALALNGHALFAGGSFKAIGGKLRLVLAA